MKYLLVAHPGPSGIVHLPPEWAETPVDYAAYTTCCDAPQETCERLLQGMSVRPTILNTHLRLVIEHCLSCAPSLCGVHALTYTRAVREWLARSQPENGIIVGEACLVKTILVGICDDLGNYAIHPGNVVLVEVETTRRSITFYKPRR